MYNANFIRRRQNQPGVPVSYGEQPVLPQAPSQYDNLFSMLGLQGQGQEQQAPSGQGGQAGGQGSNPIAGLLSQFTGKGGGQGGGSNMGQAISAMGQGISAMGQNSGGGQGMGPEGDPDLPPSPSSLPGWERNPIGAVLGDPDKVDPIGGLFGLSPSFGDIDKMVEHYLNPGREAAQMLEKMLREGIGQAKGYEKSAEGPFGMYMKGAPGIYGALLNALGQGANPGEFMNNLMSQYQMSPQAQAQIDAGTEAANRAAAASGMLGSSAAMQEAAQRAQSVRGQDLQNFIQNALGIRGQYLSGLGGLEQQGFRGAEDIANLRNMLGQQILKSYGEMGKAQASGALSGGGLMDSLGSIAGIVGMFL